ncbi:iron complex transport system substrate-binding protein [Pseudonocardia hierapolitana]|uniref:Iron complex transport system substrate-binding protein n=1 Tax=Pseudonocardia hierapolitana TaxID=1128676 RepID=A0A561SMM7_9PSEU|nr:ABC transporter substrate-binding protein [Pseudonocardia hierapolitana]TWF76102.1 iron complex transport system substrate-binding protein [Pseudonocardia hierapolitana]
MRLEISGIVAALLVVVGCSAPSDTTAPAGAGPAPGFPVTIEHALGTTTIPAPPARVVALSFEEDVLSQVGVSVVGRTENFYASGSLYPWQEGEVDPGVVPLGGPDGLDLEQVASLQPDLILATNYYGLESEYAGLSAIAPTVGYRTGWGEDTWQDTARVVGRAVGREADVERRIGEVDGSVAALAAELPGLSGKTFSSVFHHDAGQFSVDTNPDGHTAKLLGQLGMVMSPRVVAEVVNRSLGAEQVGLIDADLVRLGYASDELRAQLAASPLFRAVPAVRDGRVFESDVFGATAGNNPTLLNVPWQLEQQRAVLERVAVS